MMRAPGGCSSQINHYNCHVMNRIMLRFRPIAPKPSDASPAPDLDNTNPCRKRTKRKYVRVRGRNNKREEGSRSDRSGVDDASSPEKEGVVTLQLLPRPEKQNNGGPALGIISESSDLQDEEVSYNVTKTWITVECITEIYMSATGGLGFGVSDQEKISKLEADTCPGFVSDGSNKVVWVNKAYRRLVADDDEEVMSWLVVKEKLPYVAPSFACRVSWMIQHTKHAGGHKWNRIVSCDVWRMDFPGFAWKFDVNTALGLAI